jgi:hypothetical protein
MAACRDNLKGQVVLFFAFSGDRGEAAWITLSYNSSSFSHFATSRRTSGQGRPSALTHTVYRAQGSCRAVLLVYRL